MDMNEIFDAVLMLTWSDWDSEPRSNRYHFAIRFGQVLPVLFFQHKHQKEELLSVRGSGVENVDIVDVPSGLDANDVSNIKQFLGSRGIKNPLIWIYDPVNYGELIKALPRAFRVYHASEDYFAETVSFSLALEPVRIALTTLLKEIDMLVACSQAVAKSYVVSGQYSGPLIVSDNGCDAEFLLNIGREFSTDLPSTKMPIAIYQGGINQRLDYRLIYNVIESMTDWEFRFCGAALKSKAWQRVLKLPNVKYLGELDVGGVARQMCEATVGIIPFIQDQLIKNSLPLKAYEYVACGLPVVTVPISSLEDRADLFTTATNFLEFETAIRNGALSRRDASALRIRREAALENSYNRRFSELSQALVGARAAMDSSKRKLKGAILYDEVGSLHVNTIREHLASFQKYSMHDVTYIPATPSYWARPSVEVESIIDFSIYDFVVLHYSVRISIREHLEEGIVRVLEKFHGLKILFVQDEYEGTEIARSWMDLIQFDLVYSCVPEKYIAQVYPAYRFPATEFLQTLTGYVPDDSSIECYAKPLAARKLAIAYRGRKLPAVYGDLGYEKYQIGVEMKRVAEMRGIPADIEVDDTRRIYGTPWYEFLGSARATLGTESGSNIFDFDGSIASLIRRMEAVDSDSSFDKIRSILLPYEGVVKMNQISPKFFEAIRLRTALILFEGNYSNVLMPDRHYIPLKKDFSNIDDVILKLKDDVFITNITNRAYEDIVASGIYSYRGFIKDVDAEIGRRVLHCNSFQFIKGPLLFEDDRGNIKQAFPMVRCFENKSLNSQFIGGFPVSNTEAAMLSCFASNLLNSMVVSNSPPARRKLFFEVAILRIDDALKKFIKTSFFERYKLLLFNLLPNKLKYRMAARYFKLRGGR